MSRGEWGKTTRIINEAVEILTAEHPMTLRQCFYRLVSREIIKNNKPDYQMLSRILTKARNDERVDFAWIADRSRPTYAPCVFDNPAAYAETVKRIYRKDYWKTQSRYVEIWTEKDSVTGSIEDVTDELGVTIRVGRGYSSTTRAHEIAQHFRSMLNQGKYIRVFYLGDFDPDGEVIEQDIARRINGYIAKSYASESAWASIGHSGEHHFFQIERLAIDGDDIEEFNLPPLRVKDTSANSKAFRRKHGNKCVELDALPVSELRDRIRQALTNLIDHELWDRAVAVEKVELQSILSSMELWKSLPAPEPAPERGL